jgi:hypothetical protein
MRSLGDFLWGKPWYRFFDKNLSKLHENLYKSVQFLQLYPNEQKINPLFSLKIKYHSEEYYML